MFRGQDSELRQLRRWLRVLLPDCPARDDLISVAAELAANAIQHTASGNGGWFTVEVTSLGPVVRLDVTDQGGPFVPQVSDVAMSDRGRGLIIVQALAERYGVCGGGGGRTVWAELAWTAQSGVRQPGECWSAGTPDAAPPPRQTPPPGHASSRRRTGR